MKELDIDFDGNWKEIIIEFFEDFVAFYIPHLFPKVDFSKPIEILEQELIQILEALGSDTKRVADKLVKVWLKDGTEKWILVHIEIQSYFERLFPKRMYQMFSMIFNKYDHEIVAIAIYTNIKTPRFFDSFTLKSYGTSMIYQFIGYRIMRQNEAELLASKNIFALFVLANIYVNKTRKDFKQRLEYKEKMIELGIKRHISREKMFRFFFFIDNVMKIPVNLQQEFNNFIFSKYKTPTQMSSALYKNAKHWTDLFNKQLYGDTFENIVEKERENIVEKEREKVVHKLYIEKHWSANQIADFLDMQLVDVERIISKISKK